MTYATNTKTVNPKVKQGIYFKIVTKVGILSYIYKSKEYFCK